jgi:hypothetical protein
MGGLAVARDLQERAERSDRGEAAATPEPRVALQFVQGESEIGDRRG